MTTMSVLFAACAWSTEHLTLTLTLTPQTLKIHVLNEDRHIGCLEEVARKPRCTAWLVGGGHSGSQDDRHDISIQRQMVANLQVGLSPVGVALS